MSTFLYSAINQKGMVVRGLASAKSPEHLAVVLFAENLSLVNCDEGPTRRQIATVRWLYRSEVTRFTRQLALLLSSHVSLVEALELAGQRPTATRLGPIVQALKREIEAGRSMAESTELFPSLFDGLYRSVITSGEATGDLGTALSRLAAQREEQENFSRKVRVALAYPAFVLAVAIAVVICLIVFVIPVFASLYANVGSQVPRATQWLIDSGQFAQDHWAIGLLLLTLVAIATVSLVIRYRVGLQSLLWRLPGTRTIVQKIATARFAHALGTLLSGGVDAISASQLAAASTGDSYALQALSTVPESLAKGRTFVSSLSDTKLFPQTLVTLVAAGERTGELGDALLRAANYFEAEVQTTLQVLTSLIEPLIVVCLGILVAGILILLYLPLFQLAAF